jgi:hypothetical protein
MCATYWAKDGFCSEFIYTGPKGYKTENAGVDCTYNYTRANLTEYAESDCAYDGSFNKYCAKPGTNNDAWQERIKKWKDYINGPALSRHTVRRIAIPDDVAKLNSIIDRFPHLMFADKCAVELFSGVTASTAMVKVSVFLLGLLFFLF